MTQTDTPTTEFSRGLESVEVEAWKSFYGAAPPAVVRICGVRHDVRDGAITMIVSELMNF